MAKYLNRARQLGRMGAQYRDLKEAIGLYNEYIDECMELDTNGEEFMIEYGQQLDAMKLIINSDIDRIKEGMPKKEAAFIREYYYKGLSFPEACKALKVTQAQGAEIRRSALEHFDEIQGKHEEKMKTLFKRRVNHG